MCTHSELKRDNKAKIKINCVCRITLLTRSKPPATPKILLHFISKNYFYFPSHSCKITFLDFLSLYMVFFLNISVFPNTLKKKKSEPACLPAHDKTFVLGYSKHNFFKLRPNSPIIFV